MSTTTGSSTGSFIATADGVAHSDRALVCADCRQILPLLGNDTVALAHTSPPYNIGRRYRGFRDSQDVCRYTELLEKVIHHLFRITVPGGSVFWQVGYTALGPGQNGEPTGIQTLDAISLPIFEAAGFRLWDRIIWSYFGSMAFKSKFTNRYETILWLVKPRSDNIVAPLFQLDEVRERSRSYDGRNHLLGRNPSNIWYSERIAFGCTGQTSHVAVFPEEVSEKIVRACSTAGDLVVDPFSGTGTLPKVALSLGRRFLGCEISPEYVRESDERLRMWGWSEAENLVLGFLVEHAFCGKPGTKSLHYLVELLDTYLPNGELGSAYADLAEASREVLQAQRVTKAVKLQKQELWERYDRLIESGNALDKVVVADRALGFCYSHRKRWNGVRRYLTAGSVLRVLQDHIRSAGDTEAFIQQLCLKANTRFRIERRQVACLRADPALGCNNGGKSVARSDGLQMDLEADALTSP